MFVRFPSCSKWAHYQGLPPVIDAVLLFRGEVYCIRVCPAGEERRSCAEIKEMMTAKRESLRRDFRVVKSLVEMLESFSVSAKFVLVKDMCRMVGERSNFDAIASIEKEKAGMEEEASAQNYATDRWGID